MKVIFNLERSLENCEFTHFGPVFSIKYSMIAFVMLPSYPPWYITVDNPDRLESFGVEPSSIVKKNTQVVDAALYQFLNKENTINCSFNVPKLESSVFE